MRVVDKVIFDALAGRRSVNLPGVGSLEVKRRKAKQISEDKIIPPQNVVVFSDGDLEEGVSVVSLLVEAGERSSKKEAKALYEEWLTEVRSEGGTVVIENTGEIKDGKFVIDGQLHTALNPAKEKEIVTMEKENKNQSLWPWLLSGLLIAALLAAGIFCWKKGLFECLKEKQTEVVSVADPVTEPVDEPLVEPVPAEPQGPRFHIIAGSFSVESNADAFMATVKRTHPELTPEKLINPRNGFNLVSIYSAPTEREAYNNLDNYWDIDLYLWVYEQK